MTESLIDTVDRLKELEAKAIGNNWAPGYRETECIAADGGRGDVVLRRTNGGSMPVQENIDLICCLRNAAPALLDIMGEIRPGDAAMLQAILDDIHEREEYPGHAHFATECLRRYQAMAARMSEERDTE